MPNHKTHEIINIAALFAILGFATPIASIYNILIFTLGYLFATFLVTPDLDIKSRPYNRWGFLRILWWPYMKSIKHRGLSHHPVLGPVTLIGYSTMFWIPAILPIMYFTQLPPCALVFSTIGMTIAIELHIILDRLL